MGETKISFQSAGRKLAGTVRVPDGVKPGERRLAADRAGPYNGGSTLHPCLAGGGTDATQEGFSVQ